MTIRVKSSFLIEMYVNWLGSPLASSMQRAVADGSRTRGFLVDGLEGEGEFDEYAAVGHSFLLSKCPGQ